MITASGRPAAPHPHPLVAYLGRVALLVFGLWVFALGVACTYRAHLGLSPWECFHQGVNIHTGMSYGTASILTGAVIVGLSFLLGVRPGLGTILNMVGIGSFLDWWYAIVPDLEHAGFAWQLVMVVVGLLILGIGSGLYIKADLGAGPRDSLMLALTRRTGARVSVIRAVVELTALGLGFLLGGLVGLGTVIHALGVGPAVELGFRVCRVREA
ncbi:MAG TPA: membrane protein [Chloroflexia bacterium]|nr:membrane protein [Chloroflexia bacterium]